MSCRHRLLATFLAGVALVSIASADDTPAPYRLLVFVAYGEPLGPESLRDELERELTVRLDEGHCFEGAVRSDADRAGEADLVVEVVLDRYEESTEHDVTIATQHRQGEPGSELRWSARVGATVHLQVRRAGDRAVVMMERKNISVTRRAQPLEDTRYEARSRFVTDIVRRARSYLCKVSRKKWEKRIRGARPVDP